MGPTSAGTGERLPARPAGSGLLWWTPAKRAVAQVRLAALGLGALLALATYAVGTTHSLNVLGVQPPKEEVEAPDFALPDLSGKKIQLKDFRGKIVFLNFFATWCVPCRLEMPAMERLYRAYRDKGLVVLAVDLRETAKPVRSFLRELKVSFPALLDEDGSVAFMYGVRPLPTTYLVGRDGKILWRAFGAREWDSSEARHYFAQILADGNR